MSTITRVKRKDNFTAVDNKIIQNRDLSWQAKGLLIYILHLPDDWEINVQDLWKRAKNGRDATAKIIEELMHAGYITRELIPVEKGGKFKGYDYKVYEVPISPVTEIQKRESRNGNPETGIQKQVSTTTNDYHQELLLKEQLVEYNSTVIHDQIENTGITLHDDLASVQDNAELDVVKEKRKSPAQKKKEKPEDPTPIKAMWEILLEQSARINTNNADYEEPQYMPRYNRDFKLLYAILKARAEKRNEPIPNPAEPFRRYCTKIANFIIEGRKNSQAQFNANRLAQNFNPGFMHNSFNSICATIQAGVTQGKAIQPTRYDEKEVYAGYDSSQAAF